MYCKYCFYHGNVSYRGLRNQSTIIFCCLDIICLRFQNKCQQVRQAAFHPRTSESSLIIARRSTPHIHTHTPELSSLASHSALLYISLTTLSLSILVYRGIDNEVSYLFCLRISNVSCGRIHRSNATDDTGFHAADDCTTVCTSQSVRFVPIGPSAPPAHYPRAAVLTLCSLRVVIHVAFYLSLSFTATGSVVLRNLFIRIYARTLTPRLQCHLLLNGNEEVYIAYTLFGIPK